MGRHRGVAAPPQVLQWHQLRGAEGQEGERQASRLCRVTHALGMMRWGVVPDQQRGHIGTDGASRLHRRQHLVRATALAECAHQFPRRHLERPQDGAPPVATADQHHRRLAASAPPRP